MKRLGKVSLISVLMLVLLCTFGFTQSQETGAIEAVPRHSEISNMLAQKICRNLSVPEIGKKQ